ncbi:hypothetical protein GMW39_10645 [Pectobacterium parmentieri]|uniref:hypothetical protein n=1 Tax=Pectobacterium parmentieri TaxID=1905730 RepID=UPI0013738985|nr:hypothetical protein [Pectobacterium parmentieri]QHQ16284.1 hypothetical protein GMW39_10645 [Pectobacterium parmentieri]
MTAVAGSIESVSRCGGLKTKTNGEPDQLDTHRTSETLYVKRAAGFNVLAAGKTARY